MDEEKTTVPVSSAATDAEQPCNLFAESSIPENEKKVNPPSWYSKESYIFMRDTTLQFLSEDITAFTMNELFDVSFPARPPVIEGLLYSGTYLFVGAPKVGKSFLMAQLAYHVSTGRALWNYPVRQGTVLYLALEDDHQRLQGRLFRMFGTEGAEKLFFSVEAKSMKDGLEKQLTNFIHDHRDTNLIIIDTLQKVRASGGDGYSYANDYEVINSLKQFADDNGICILLVHHTRKQMAEDRFDMISGTTVCLARRTGHFCFKRTDGRMLKRPLK